jgi:anti-sigma B factor antagonist
MAANPIAPSAALQVQVRMSGDELIVLCAGKLTSETSSLLKSEVKPLISQTRSLVLDLAELNYMDSSGLGTLVGLYASARSNGCELKLVKLGPRVKELLRLTKLISVFEPFGEHL